MSITSSWAKGPPETRREIVTDDYFGEKIDDPYRWLEDQQSPETRKWIAEQNAHTEGELANFPGRNQLQKRLGELLKVDTMGLPTVRGSRFFFTKRAADQDLPVIAMREGDNGRDEVLLDPKKMREDGSLTVSLLDVSKDGSLLIYGQRIGGEDEVTVRFYDVPNRKDLSWELPRGRYFGMSLTPDKKTLFYSLHDGKTGSRVYRRAFSPDAQAEELFGQGYDAGVGIHPGLSHDGRYLLVQVWYGSAALKTELFAQDLQQPDAKLQPIIKDIEARFEGSAIGSDLYVLTNLDAPRGRLLKIDLQKPQRDNWKEIVPQGAGVLEEFSLVGGKIFANYLEKVRSRVAVFEPTGKHVRDIQFPSLGTVGAISGEWNQPNAYYTFSSFHIPTTIYQEAVSTAKTDVWYRSQVPVHSDQLELEQVEYSSKDGTKIPMFILQRKGLVRDGKTPTILYGYGGFNISLTPQFSATASLWCEQGGVYAVANLRGGGEFGEEWHKAGMVDKKQNVFDDFAAAAEYLIREKYTSSEHLGITGRSNGGLLVGTLLTQRPELYRAVVCGYPLLDMLRFHKFLVARFWIPEYGSSEDPDQYRVLKAYSPYHHVKPGVKYPATLFVTGDADTRVDPLHARKMVALMQASPTPERPVYLRYDTKLGHTGARPVNQTIADLTIELGFLARELGLKFENAPKTAGEKLQQLFDEEWEYTLREAPTFASHLGDPRYNAQWPDVSLAAIEKRQAHARELLKKLEEFPHQSLTLDEQLNLRLFEEFTKWDVQEIPFGWYLIPLNQREGIQDESTVADSLHFVTTKDYEDWLARLKAFPNYLEQTTALMRAGIAKRMVHPRVIMQRLPGQIKRQIVDNPEQSLYYKPFRNFPKDISPKDQQRLQTEAKQAIAEGIVPGYQQFLKFFEEEYLPACLPEVGAWQLPRGDEFYAFKARQFTTTNLTPEEIHQIGLKEVARIRAEMEQIVKDVKFQGTFREFLQHLRTDKRFFCSTDQELFNSYQAVCKRIDPGLPKLFKRLPKIPYDLQPIPAHMAPDTTTGYYRPPAADGSRPGTYFVNLYRPEVRPTYEMEALSLHEAVPGHHLQIALATELENVPNFRRFSSVTAFIEGWGLYAESLGGELGCYKDPYSKFGQLTYEMWRAVRLVVDTGIHAKKWKRQQAIDFFLENTAKTELDITNEVDRYIAWPGQALAYKIGELKIKELRAEAQRRLGPKFDIREFHDVVLNQGAIPLTLLEQRVKNWIVAQL